MPIIRRKLLLLIFCRGPPPSNCSVAIEDFVETHFSSWSNWLSTFSFLLFLGIIGTSLVACGKKKRYNELNEENP